MRIAFKIISLYAFCGVLYYPSLDSLFALIYILMSCSPLLFVSCFIKEKISPYKGLNDFYFWSVLALGIYNLRIIAVKAGNTFMDIFSVDGIVQIALKSTTARYVTDTEANSGSPILLALSLWLIYRIGTIQEQVSGYKKVLAFMPILMYTILTTEKWPSFLILVFFFAGVISGNSASDLFRIFRKYIVFIFLLITLMIISLSLRGADESTWTAVDTLLHYLFAQYNSLGIWIQEEAHKQIPTFGSYTFIGPLNFIGEVDRHAGVFAKSMILKGKESNIYTAFRYLIQDYTIIGPFLLNVIISIFYFIFSSVRLDNFTNTIKVFIIFCALLSLNITPFVHNSVTFGIILSIISSVFAIKLKTIPTDE